MSANSRTEAARSGPAPTPPAGETSGLKKIVAASMVGTVVEWYEFFLYATAASLVFATVFFPNAGSQLDGIIAAFLTYAVGFIARPLGGIVFGQIGDRLGRKHTLQVTIILVGVATFLMGCLPGFDTIGYWAPALLWRCGSSRASPSAANGAARFCSWPSTAPTSPAGSGPAGPSPPFRSATCSPPSFS